MMFASWAPVDLIEYYNKFPGDADTYVLKLKQIVFRLLTRPEMEQVWSWVEKQNMHLSLTANGGMVGRFIRAIDDFEKTAKIPASERADDFKEMKRLTMQLSIKLEKYKFESHAFNQLTALIPKEFDEKLITLLKDEYQQKLIARKKLAYEIRFPFWDILLPHITVIIKKLYSAIEVSDSELSRVFPTKIKQISALNTYLVNIFYNQFEEECPPSIVATFLSVALDDSTITSDKVGKVRRTFLEKS